jgi:hypothetical protein
MVYREAWEEWERRGRPGDYKDFERDYIREQQRLEEVRGVPYRGPMPAKRFPELGDKVPIAPPFLGAAGMYQRGTGKGIEKVRAPVYGVAPGATMPFKPPLPAGARLAKGVMYGPVLPGPRKLGVRVERPPPTPRRPTGVRVQQPPQQPLPGYGRGPPPAPKKAYDIITVGGREMKSYTPDYVALQVSKGARPLTIVERATGARHVTAFMGGMPKPAPRPVPIHKETREEMIARLRRTVPGPKLPVPPRPQPEEPKEPKWPPGMPAPPFLPKPRPTPRPGPVPPVLPPYPRPVPKPKPKPKPRTPEKPKPTPKPTPKPKKPTPAQKKAIEKAIRKLPAPMRKILLRHIRR